MRLASWPGPARKPTPPPPEPDPLLAEVLRQLGLEFAGFGLALAALLALVALAGCEASCSLDIHSQPADRPAAGDHP